MIELEVVVDDQVSFRTTRGDGANDPKCQWAAKVEERAREIFKGSPDRIVFHYTKDGIKVLSDGESKASVMSAVRELYDQMPASVQAFMLDVTAMLQNEH